MKRRACWMMKTITAKSSATRHYSTTSFQDLKQSLLKECSATPPSVMIGRGPPDDALNLEPYQQSIMLKLRKINALDDLRKFVNGITSVSLAKNVVPTVYVFDLMENKLKYLCPTYSTEIIADLQTNSDSSSEVLHASSRRMFQKLLVRSIRICVSNGDLHTASALYERMINRYKFNHLYWVLVLFVQEYCKRSDMENAVRWLRCMEDIKSPATYRSIIEGFIKLNDPKSATTFYNEMKAKGMNPGVRLWQSIQEQQKQYTN